MFVAQAQIEWTPSEQKNYLVSEGDEYWQFWQKEDIDRLERKRERSEWEWESS